MLTSNQNLGYITEETLILRAPKIKSWILSDGNFNVFLPEGRTVKFRVHLVNKATSVWILINGKRTFNDIYQLVKPRMEKSELQLILEVFGSQKLVRFNAR